MLRTTVSINDRAFALAQGSDIDRIKADLLEAVQAGGQFVDVVIVGNRALSILVTAGIPIVFEVETVPADDRDTGDTEHPYDAIDLYIPDSFL